MKNIVLLIFLLTALSVAKPIRIGGGSGASLYYTDLSDHFWDAPLWGLDLSYPIRKRVPVVLSLYGSRHLPKAGWKPTSTSNAQTMCKNTTLRVLFINVDIAFEYALWQKRKISPLWGAGFTSTTMVAYYNWPPQNNDDESEIGITGNTGLRFNPNEKVNIDILYKQYMLFTEPRYLTFGSVVCRFMVEVNRRNREK